MDALLGRTVIEAKRDLRQEKFEDQLAGYLKDRKAETGQDFVGIVSDGATFSVHELAKDSETLERVGAEFKPSVENPFGLLNWLESVVALQDRLPPEVERIKLELGRDSVLYPRAMRELRRLWGHVGSDPEVVVKRQLWDRLLRVSYGSEVEAPELFLQHTYLVIVAKAVATAAFVSHLPDSGRDLLDGKEFRELGIVGAVEADFFDWLLSAGEGDALVLKIARQAARFDLEAIEADVLKGLYESLIDPEQRHELGEYYTPDWLAAWIVAEAIKDSLEQRVIDPACGSGTFLSTRSGGWRQRGGTRAYRPPKSSPSRRRRSPASISTLSPSFSRGRHGCWPSCRQCRRANRSDFQSQFIWGTHCNGTAEISRARISRSPYPRWKAIAAAT